MGTDLKSIYEDALKAEYEGKKEEAIQLYEVAGSYRLSDGLYQIGRYAKE